MQRYASSKMRMILLGVLLLAAGWIVSPAFAQTASADPSAPDAKPAGLFQLILSHPDPVFFTIVLLSIAGLTLIIQGFLKNRSAVFMPPASTQQIRDLIARRQFRELIEFTEQDPSFVSRALNPALKRAPIFRNMKEAMETAIGEQTAEQFRRIEYLNIIGNLGPLLGLLGTVLGMIEAFSAMQSKGGQANPADLAGGISTALTHTFLGLFLAVPCLAAFGVLRTMVDRLTVRGALVSEELLMLIEPAEAKSPPVVQTPPRATPQPEIAGAPTSGPASGIRKPPSSPTPQPQ